MGFKVVKTEGGKTNWPFLRHVGYTLLIVWAVGVRWAGVDPFGDIFALKITPATLLDLLVLYALWMFVWLILYPIRPRFGASTN